MRPVRPKISQKIVRGVLALAVGLCALPVAAEPDLEAAIKATYLYKFAPFVTWPQTNAEDSFVICVVGKDPFGEKLDRAVSGQYLENKPFRIVRMSHVTSSAPCHVAYLGGSKDQSVEHAVKALKGQPVLTVSEGDRGAIVGYVLAQERVRFTIDLKSAKANGLTVSSKLLALALKVRPDT